MTQTILTPSVIAQEALMILENQLVWAGLVYRDHETEFTGKKVGDTVSIRGPASFTVSEFTTDISVQEIVESSVDLKLEKHFDISVALTAKERTLDLESYSSQVLQPQMVAMAQAIDAYIATKTIELHNFVGTAGSPPDEWAHVVAVNKRAQTAKIPQSGRVAVVDPAAEAELLGLTQFTSANVRGDGGQALRDANMGRVLNIDWYQNQNVPTHTSGELKSGGGTLVDGVHAVGVQTITLKSGDATGTAKVGDLVTFATDPNQYRVTEDLTLVTGAGYLKIEPGLVIATEGDEVVTQIASHTRNAIFHPNCFALAVVPLELPSGAADAQYVQSNGIALRLVSGYDMTKKKDVISLDCLVGAKCIQPALGARILG